MMETPRERPPEYSFHHDPTALKLPAVPKHDFNSPPPSSDVKLPAISSVLSPGLQASSPAPSAAVFSPGSTTSAAALSRMDRELTPRASIESGAASPIDTASVMSMDDRTKRSMSVVSMEDPDVRIAAEALSGLGNPEFARSPSTVVGQQSPGVSVDLQNEPEPLLQLLAQAHPWVGNTINGSISAHATIKQYSPRFVRYGAKLLERNVTTPVVSTVSNVSKLTGAERGIRWYLEARRPSMDLEAGPADLAAIRKQLGDDEGMIIESGLVTPTDELRRGSQPSHMEHLPAYPHSRPPSYREEESPASTERAPANRSLSSQVFIMTSGLGCALSERSRESLRYCLTGLSQATQHVQTVTDALKLVLEQYDEARKHCEEQPDGSLEKAELERQMAEYDEASRRLAEIVKKHSDDIWHTLKNVVNYVSTTAGGALPENARHFVRSQLMSLPQRWRAVAENGETSNGATDTSRSAHRMVAFATEGLDMMSQVSQVCKATLDSADLWLQRVGRRRGNNASATPTASEKTSIPHASEDQVMTDV